MDILRFDQIIVLTAFMAVLAVVWLLVQRYKPKLSAKLQSGRRLLVHESVALTPQHRATILSVDGRDFLVVHAKTGTPAIQPLEATPQDSTQAGGQA